MVVIRTGIDGTIRIFGLAREDMQRCQTSGQVRPFLKEGVCETSTVYCPGELDGWTSAAILAVLVFPWSYMSGRLFTICTLAATIGSPPAVGSGAD